MRLHAPSLYLDTSVLGGYFDAEFQVDTRALWQLRDAGRFRFVSSRLVSEEIAKAPKRVQALMRVNFSAENVLEHTVEAEELAQSYLKQAVVPSASYNDAYHVAICCVARLNCLVSWNFKHLANPQREAGFNAVNGLQGYPAVRIVTPTSLLDGHEEKNL